MIPTETVATAVSERPVRVIEFETEIDRLSDLEINSVMDVETVDEIEGLDV